MTDGGMRPFVESETESQSCYPGIFHTVLFFLGNLPFHEPANEISFRKGPGKAMNLMSECLDAFASITIDRQAEPPAWDVPINF